MMTLELKDRLHKRKNAVMKLTGEGNVVDEVLAYCESLFHPDSLPQSPVFPMKEEPHLRDWREYLDELPKNHFEYFQARIPQLNIPVREGISQTEAYADIVRRGNPFEEKTFNGRLQLCEPESFGVSIYDHPAGALPVVSTEDRQDFETLYRALGCRNEPAPIEPSVNAQMVAGFINWDRVHRYRLSWSAGNNAAEWNMEMARVAREESWRFRDRFILVFKSPYSGVSAGELGLRITEESWLEKSAHLRIEHEFTHYATKRLYHSMRLNLLDETICDFMGITAALGEFRAGWFLRFMGLENHPSVAPGGRIYQYTRELSEKAFQVAAAVLVQAAENLEDFSRKHDLVKERARLLLALTFIPLDLMASNGAEALLHESYEKAGAYC